MHPPPTTVSIVVPVRCGETTLLALNARITDACRATGLEHEVILVDDASPDGTWAAMEALAQASDRVRGVGLVQQSGQHAALLCGLREARSPVTVTIDDDLRHPPEEIVRLVDSINGGCDLVYGAASGRRSRPGGSLLSRLLLARTAGMRIALGSTSFRAIRTSLRESIPERIGNYPCLDVYLNAAATRVECVPVSVPTPPHHPTRYRPSTLARLTLAAGRRPIARSEVTYEILRRTPAPAEVEAT